MNDQYLAVPAEAMKQAEKSAKQGFNLTVPDAVERTGDLALWPELVVVEAAYREDAVGKPKNGHNGGQQRIQYVIKYKVKAFEYDDNVGRKLNKFILVNHGWLHGDESFLGDLPESRWSGETTMNNMSLTLLKSLLTAADYDMSEGITLDITEDAFPTKSASTITGLLGKELTFRFKDKLKDDGTSDQDIVAIFPGPDDE